jgi:hypothetical protein
MKQNKVLTILIIALLVLGEFFPYFDFITH